MGKQCVLNNCRNLSRDNKMFKFPFRDSELLAKWLENIPKDLYVVIENPAYICEHHFEKKFIRTGSGFKRLHPSAIPTIFNESRRKIPKSSNKRLKCPDHNNTNCRFCLKKFQDDEKQVEINNYIRKQFYVITQTELKASKVYSDQICETCFNSARDLATFRLKLLENQQKLEEAFIELEDEKPRKRERNSADDDNPPEIPFVLSQTEAEEVTVKVEQMSEDEDQFNFNNEDVKMENDESDEDGNDFGFMHDWPESSRSPASLIPENEYRNFLQEDFKTGRKMKSKISLDSSTVKSSADINGNKKMCEICGRWFSSMSYKRHYDRIHLKITKVECDICGYKAFKKFDMRHHVMRHMNLKTHFCHECPSSFASKPELRNHMRVHSDKRDFVCNLENCSAAFKSKDALKRHTRTHLNDRKHECSECSRKFFDPYRLRLHQQSAHLPADPSLETPCPICHKTYKNPKAMNKHLVYHKPPQHRCDICQKEFYVMKSLQLHVKVTHEGKRDFQCKYCSSTFSKNCHVNRHILTMHMKQKVACQAEGCHQTFPLKERYKLHIMSHHQNLGEEKVKELIEGIKTIEVTYEHSEFELNETVYR